MRRPTFVAVMSCVLVVPAARAQVKTPPPTTSTPMVQGKPAPTKLSTVDPSVAAFRTGLQASYNNQPYGSTLTITTHCTPGTTSACAAGTPPLSLTFRFPALAQAASLGPFSNKNGVPSTADWVYYMFMQVRDKGPQCGGSSALPGPLYSFPENLDLTRNGPAFPVVCQWVAIGASKNLVGAASVVWSDTVTVVINNSPSGE